MMMIDLFPSHPLIEIGSKFMQLHKYPFFYAQYSNGGWSIQNESSCTIVTAYRFDMGGLSINKRSKILTTFQWV